MEVKKLSQEGNIADFTAGALRKPHFWAEAWSGAHKNSLKARRRRDLDPLDYWNRLAGRFERRAEQERTRRRVARVLSWLEERGVLQSGMEVLDIGAGTGVFTVPLARRGAKVTALEPALAMLAALQKRVEAQGLANIHFLDREWEKVGPVQEEASLKGGAGR